MSRLYLLCLQDHIAKSQLKSEDAIDDTRCRDGVYKASRLPVHSVFSQGQAWPAAVVGFARLEKALGSSRLCRHCSVRDCQLGVYCGLAGWTSRLNACVLPHHCIDCWIPHMAREETHQARMMIIVCIIIIAQALYIFVHYITFLMMMCNTRLDSLHFTAIFL